MTLGLSAKCDRAPRLSAETVSIADYECVDCYSTRAVCKLNAKIRWTALSPWNLGPRSGICLIRNHRHTATCHLCLRSYNKLCVASSAYKPHCSSQHHEASACTW